MAATSLDFEYFNLENTLDRLLGKSREIAVESDASLDLDDALLELGSWHRSVTGSSEGSLDSSLGGDQEGSNLIHLALDAALDVSLELEANMRAVPFATLDLPGMKSTTGQHVVRTLSGLSDAISNSPDNSWHDDQVRKILNTLEVKSAEASHAPTQEQALKQVEDERWRLRGAESDVDSDANIRNFAPVARIMKTALPEDAKIEQEAKECMQECVSDFISFITSEAIEKSQQEKRKTVNGEDILFAMTSLGFENYGEALKVFLARYRENLVARGREGVAKAKESDEAQVLAENETEVEDVEEYPCHSSASFESVEGRKRSEDALVSESALRKRKRKTSGSDGSSMKGDRPERKYKRSGSA